MQLVVTWQGMEAQRKKQSDKQKYANITNSEKGQCWHKWLKKLKFYLMEIEF